MTRNKTVDWVCRLLTIVLATAFVAAPGQRGQRATPRAVKREVLLPFLNEASAHLEKGELPAAAQALEQALSLIPNDPGVTFNLAQVYVRMGQKEKALTLLNELARRGLGFHPDADPAFAVLAELPEYPALLQLFERNDPVVSRSKKAFVLAERDLFPEGIACDGDTGTLYVGSILKRKIVRITRDGRVTDFVSPAQDGLLGVLGVRVDAKRRELWAVSTGGPEIPSENGHSGVYRFDLKSGRLLKRYVLPTDGPHNLNDLAMDSNGNVYLTDTATGAVYQILAPDGELTEFLPVRTFRAPNGIAVSDDNRFLFVASAGRGISVVNRVSKQIVDLAAPPDVVALGLDGLYFHQNSLIGVQNGIGRGRVVRYLLASPTEVKGAQVLESRSPALEVPTTGAICGRDFFFMANTQLDKANAEGILTPDDKMQDIVILRLRL